MDLDLNKLVAYGIPLSEVVNKIRVSNGDVGGKIFEVGSTEYYVRGRGYIKSLADVEQIPVKLGSGGVPVTLAEPVTLGPRLRHYLRAIVEGEEARLTGPQGSGILTSMARANALLIVPADMPAVPVGTELQALILDDPRHVAEPPY